MESGVSLKYKNVIEMENVLSRFKENIDALLADINGRAEEVKENFSSFRDVFGKEFQFQADHMKVYRERLETKGRKVFNAQQFVADIREEVDFAVKDFRSAVDRVFDAVKKGIEDAK